MNLSDLTVPYMAEGAIDWNDDGVVVLKNFMPEELMISYEECWIKNNATGTLDNYEMTSPGGWSHCTPYMEHEELLNILSYGPLHQEMQRLIGEPVGVHLNLTGWVSTTRNWHQDSYLNPSHVGDYYIAAWIALGDIDIDSGPFQYVPQSHLWPQVTREKILNALSPEDRNEAWPTHSEKILTPLFEQELRDRNSRIETYLPSRGDVLLWHSRLLHRGSVPNKPNMERRSLIAHYSGINHRVDMPSALQHGDGYYFPVNDVAGKR